MTRRRNEVNVLIYCACGCGEQRPKYDSKGKERKFISGHHTRTGNYLQRMLDKQPRGQKCHTWKGGMFINTQGYVMIYAPDHPFKDCRGYVREHRLVMEQYLARYLEPYEVVHHINEDKTDNRIENLELIESNGKHRILHQTIDMSKRQCHYCRIKYEYLVRNRVWHHISKMLVICHKCFMKVFRQKLVPLTRPDFPEGYTNF